MEKILDTGKSRYVTVIKQGGKTISLISYDTCELSIASLGEKIRNSVVRANKSLVEAGHEGLIRLKSGNRVSVTERTIKEGSKNV
jgi:hypothetical protein